MVTTVSRDIWFFRTNTNITDANGDLLFSTNGAYIANATGDTMQNGTGLNPSWYTSQYPEGLHIPQACLILPKPESSTEYYLFHSTIDRIAPNNFALQLYSSTVDMSLDGGLGAVVAKNEVVISDSLVAGRITAVRHANGRDWWLLCHRRASNVYYRVLLLLKGLRPPCSRP